MSAAARRPRVTVLLPVYNTAPFLREAIESIRAQTFREFALLVLDDGSTDDSGAIADACAATDPRIRVEHLPHQGLIATLNHGLDAIDTEYIVRADADDINRPDRLARQIALLDARPEIGVCGSWIEVIPSGHVWPLPEDPDALSATLPFVTPVHNSTSVLRRDWIARSGIRFDPAFPHAEDYEFWDRADRLTRMTTLPAALVRYRHHSGQVSSVHRATQLASAAALRHRQLLALGLQPTDAERGLHEDAANTAAGYSLERLEACRQWLERLRVANRAARRYPEPAFTRMLAWRLYRNCVEAARHQLPAAAVFRASSLTPELPGAWHHRARLHALRVVPFHLARRALQLTYRLHDAG